MPSFDLPPAGNLDQNAHSFGQAFPDLHPIGSLQPVGKGFSSLVVETPTQIVFRVAWTLAAGMACH